MALFDSTFAPYEPFGSRNLSLGSHGTDVAVLQAVYDLMLKMMTPPGGPMGDPISISGTFDADTKTAVENIQSYFGLVVDGVVGAETFFVFGQGVGPHQTYGGPVFGSRALSEGMAGGDVTILQNRLNCFQYATILDGPATGTFDTATGAAVAAFKASASSNGDTGFPNNQIAGFGYYDANWIYTFAGGRAIFSGRNGFDVVFIQSILTTLDYYTGDISGYYDNATESAVEAFQAAQGISNDGVVGPVTFYYLGLKNPKPAPDPLGIAWPPTIVTECSVALSSIVSDVNASFGVASLAASSYQAGQWLNVVGDNLPSPDIFGSNFTTYAFTLSDATTGAVSSAQVMLVVPSGPGTWAGTMENASGDFTPGLVNVYPSNPTGSLLGTAILEGNLVNCK